MHMQQNTITFKDLSAPNYFGPVVLAAKPGVLGTQCLRSRAQAAKIKCSARKKARQATRCQIKIRGERKLFGQNRSGCASLYLSPFCLLHTFFSFASNLSPFASITHSGTLVSLLYLLLAFCPIQLDILVRMRFFVTIAAFGLVAFASAQSTTEQSSAVIASSTSASAPASTSVAAETKCLNACAASDICCQAKCVGVPCPSQSQANATTECAAQCPQGNGTKDDTSSYAACQSSCISSLFLSTSTGAGGAAATATGSGSAGSTTAAGTGIGKFLK